MEPNGTKPEPVTNPFLRIKTPQLNHISVVCNEADSKTVIRDRKQQDEMLSILRKQTFREWFSMCVNDSKQFFYDANSNSLCRVEVISYNTGEIIYMDDTTNILCGCYCKEYTDFIKKKFCGKEKIPKNDIPAEHRLGLKRSRLGLTGKTPIKTTNTASRISGVSDNKVKQTDPQKKLANDKLQGMK
jgi:hypothetical protein